MKKNILITGGPVHAYLDAVKIITNRFKGGLMADLADRLHNTAKANVIYLTSKAAALPANHDLDEHDMGGVHVIYHDGIDDYMEKVCSIAPNVDAVVLGAAVANLVPKNKISGKFPSHDYKPGDSIPIEFTIAERIIDQVKKVNPNVHLFGYKLLAGVDYYELIRAAYGVLLESKAVTVFANDAKNLMQKYAVTKERGVHPMHNDEVAKWILARMKEKYYSTLTAKTDKISDAQENARDALRKIIDRNINSFITTDEGFVFGSAALMITTDGKEFVTTSRGKDEAANFAFVDSVDHDNRKVYCATTRKATLNAPLFSWMFTHLADISYILHFHHQREDLMTLEYATPGTDKDSKRLIVPYRSFNIKGHGCILAFDEEGKMLK